MHTVNSSRLSFSCREYLTDGLFSLRLRKRLTLMLGVVLSSSFLPQLHECLFGPSASAGAKHHFIHRRGIRIVRRLGGSGRYLARRQLNSCCNVVYSRQ